MKVIDFKEFPKMPMSVRVMCFISLGLVLTGMTMLIMNIMDKGNVQLSVALAFIVASQVITVFGLKGYKDRMYK